MPSHLERLFEIYWEDLFPRVTLWAEQRLIPNRRFRFDFVHFPSKVAIEINGGNWVRGRHTRPQNLNQEYEKILLASKEGFIVLPLSQDQVTPEYLTLIHTIIQKRLA